MPDDGLLIFSFGEAGYLKDALPSGQGVFALLAAF